jgi:hypothetical protein
LLQHFVPGAQFCDVGVGTVYEKIKIIITIINIGVSIKDQRNANLHPPTQTAKEFGLIQAVSPSGIPAQMLVAESITIETWSFGKVLLLINDAHVPAGSQAPDEEQHSDPTPHDMGTLLIKFPAEQMLYFSRDTQTIELSGLLAHTEGRSDRQFSKTSQRFESAQHTLPGGQYCSEFATIPKKYVCKVNLKIQLDTWQTY